MAKEDDAARYFTVGTEVEVSNEDEGFRGSWYSAIVITPPTPPPSQRVTIRAFNALSPTSVANSDLIRKVTIEFKELMVDEESNTPLRETLDLLQIRPVPPRERSVDFKLNDSVDAFYNDGWWEGVIVKELENDRFDVYFRASKELIEFSGVHLRIHREWVNGGWVPPLKDDLDENSEVSADGKPSRAKRSKPSGASPIVKKSSKVPVLPEKKLKASSALGNPLKSPEVRGKSYSASLTSGSSSKAKASEKTVSAASTHKKQDVKEKFVEGTDIEVKSDEDGFRGAWFAATILKVLSNDKFLIEYKKLKSDNGKELCREEVDKLHIRPTPPDILKVDAYSMHDEVDALYKDGWWVGVISKVYTGSKYMVFFRGTNEELKFNHSALRVHQEWIDGKWYMPSKVLKS